MTAPTDAGMVELIERLEKVRKPRLSIEQLEAAVNWLHNTEAGATYECWVVGDWLDIELDRRRQSLRTRSPA